MQRPEISELPTSSKKRKSTSEVWNHFSKDTEKNGKVWAIREYCGKLFSGSSKDETTHLNNHLNSSKCKESQKEKISSSETGGLENPTVTNGNFVFDEERSGLDLVRMIVKNGYPLNMVEHEDFKIFVKNLQPMFKLHSQDTLKDRILRVYREEKEKVRKQFDKLLSFSLILNFWTDCGKKNKYCSFTLQFIEDGPKLKKKIIAIKNVEYNYAGKTLFEIVKGVLLEWNIDKKLATITVESSSANDQMVEILGSWLDDQGNCHPFRGNIFHIPCITHVINILVQDGLDEIDYILHKIRKAIKYMSVTTIGKQKYEEVVKKLNLGGKDITSEGVPLRWDSTFFMLRIALDLRRQGDAFVDLQSSNCVCPINLSMEEWDKAEVMHKCLTVFYDAICSFFGSKCLYTNVYFRKISDILVSLNNRWQESYIVKKMKVNLIKYTADVLFVSSIVAAFDPRTKLDFVEYSFKRCFGDSTEYRTRAYNDLDNIFNIYAEYLMSQGLSSSFINNNNSSSSDGDDSCNILDEWKKSKRQRTELDKYLQDPLHPDGEFDILDWWHTKSRDSPALWTMAHDFLAIPMSTTTSTSAFCIETTTFDPIFNGLDPDIIEALFCGKDWLDNPIWITPNKDNDHSTTNPEPMLEISGSTSGLEPLPTGDTSHVWSGTLAPQQKHDPSNADTELVLANGSTTSCPKPLLLPTKEVSKMKRPEISASYKVTSAPLNSSKKRKSTSDIWNHFIKETDQNGKVRAKCKHCGKCSSGLSKDETTHLKNHLNSSKCKRSQKETGGLENPTVTNGNFVFDEERSGLDLVRMIIKNGYPLNMVEHEDFIIFVKNLQPMIKLPSQDTLKDKILCFYREEKEKLRKQFDKVLSFSLILNFWTDCGKKSKYCSFTLQFIEDGPKLMKKNIAIKNVEYNYTGETLFEIVKFVLLEWNIDKKLATITVEISNANNQMVSILERWLLDQGNCHPFRKIIFQIPCITHIINLLVKDGLDEIDYILHKIRKDIKYMNETTIGKQKFEEVVKKLNLGGKDITLEGVPVRWDSTFFMLQIALELRRQGEAFVNLQNSDCVVPMNLSMEEWDKAKVVHKYLTVFYDAICSFFGSKCLGTNVYFCKIFDIFKGLNHWQEIEDIAYKMIDHFEGYFDEVSYVNAIVAVFDPRTKLDFVQYSLKLFSSTIDKHWITLRVVLDNMFNLYAKYLTSQRSSSSFINNDNSSSSDGDDPFNILDDWKKSRRQRTELEKYLQEPLQPDEEFDRLGWWHTKSQDSPTLWTMARDILAIPMSTSTSNSAFCIETMTLDPIFNDLDPDIIEALFCGKDWLDNPIRITPIKDSDHSTANPEPMLEISGSTSGLEPLPTGDTSHVWSGTLAPQEKHDLSIADTELVLGNCRATSCPDKPLPTKEFGLVDEEIMNVFEPYTEIEKIICNYIFNEDLDGREVLVDMKYEFGERAAFNALLPNQWITDEIINLVICKMTKEKRFSKIHAWYLPTRFSQRMMYEDGNPTLSWFKKSFRDNDKYMSKLVNCKQIFIPMNDNDSHWYLCVVELIPNKCIYILDSLPSTTKQDIRTKDVKTVVTGLDKLLSYLEKDNYIDSITKFALKSSPLNPRQNNGYDCGMYVIKHICTNIINSHLPLLEGESERFRYKLATNLVLSKDNEQRSNIIERAKKIPLKDYFLSLK